MPTQNEQGLMMQNKTWVFSLITSAILVAFYFFAKSIGAEASGFLVTAFLIIGSTAFIALQDNRAKPVKQLHGGN